jgi:nucleotide-binding universal stress UspA family protein
MKIVVAVDRYDECDSIATFITNLDWGKNASFKIVHAIDSIAVESPISSIPAPIIYELTEKRSEEGVRILDIMSERIRKAFPSSEVYSILQDGHAKERVVDLAKQWGADLIIVGSRNRNDLAKALFGSVSLSILKAAPCSVLVARSPKKEELSAVSMLTSAIETRSD